LGSCCKGVQVPPKPAVFSVRIMRTSPSSNFLAEIPSPRTIVSSEVVSITILSRLEEFERWSKVVMSSMSFRMVLKRKERLTD